MLVFQQNCSNIQCSDVMPVAIYQQQKEYSFICTQNDTKESLPLCDVFSSHANISCITLISGRTIEDNGTYDNCYSDILCIIRAVNDVDEPFDYFRQ